MIELLAASSFSYPKDSGKMNEDCILPPRLINDGYLFAVADGVGSYKGAKLASSVAIKTLSNIEHIQPTSMDEIFNNIRNRVRALALGDEAFHSAATTLTLCYANHEGLLIGHVGDCRLYVNEGKKTQQLTKDDTQHQMLIDQKLFTAKDLKDKPGKNILTTAIAGNVVMDNKTFFIPYDELPVCDGVINIHIMSDGAHHFWEKRPRLSENTMKSPPKFSASLLRRIERNGPIDDYSVVSACFSV